MKSWVVLYPVYSSCHGRKSCERKTVGIFQDTCSPVCGQLGTDSGRSQLFDQVRKQCRQRGTRKIRSYKRSYKRRHHSHLNMSFSQSDHSREEVSGEFEVGAIPDQISGGKTNVRS